METPFKFRHVNELTGFLVLGVLALVVAAVIFSGHSQGWFARKYTFDVRLPEEGALGLRRGDDVFILGVSAGLVDDITVGNDGGMTARVKTRRDFERFVRVDSTACIKKVFGVAGDSFMEITRGSGAALPSDQPSIVCLASEDSLGRMEKLLTGLHSELMPVVQQLGTGFGEWTKLAADLRKNAEELHQFVARLDTLALGVEQGKGSAGKLFTETALADEAQRLLSQANETMGELRGVVTNLDAAVDNVQKGTARLPELTDVVANESKDLPGLVHQTQTSMRELERLTQAMQRHWLLRKYVNKTNPPPLRPLPESEEPARKPFKPLTSPKATR
jgi:phospholipid/cholesterol/gamma-HCH transport system substrate-binding protein